MKTVSKEKRGSVRCNGDFISTEGDKWCGLGGYYSTSGTKVYLSMNCSNIDIGNAISESLSKSINFPYSDETMDALKEESNRDWSEQFKYLRGIYKYKTSSEVFRNMMSCPLELNEEELKISPMENIRGGWNGLEDENDIIIRTETPKELIGGAVRYAFVRCRGNGAGKVEEALFPEGRPSSLEEYLNSINPDYKTWLISYRFLLYMIINFQRVGTALDRKTTRGNKMGNNFRKSRLSKQKQRKLVEYFVAGTSARCVAEMLGINKNTAWAYFKKFRTLIEKNSQKNIKFTGEIELDESYFDVCKNNKERTDRNGKVLVLGILKRGGNIYTSIIDNIESKTLYLIIKEKIELNSTVFSDCHSAHNILDGSEFKHYWQTFADKYNHTNGVENFWKQAKRHMRKFNGIPREQFYLYLKECEWRFNTRSLLTMKSLLLQWIKSDLP